MFSANDCKRLAKIILALVALAFCWLQTVGAIGAGEPSQESPGKIDFARDVAPIFTARCLECHGKDKQRGGMRLDSPAGVRAGGSSGAIVLPRNPDGSLLYLHVAGATGYRRMPPKGEPLSSRQIATIRRWIDEGATIANEAPTTDDAATPTPPADGWAFQPITRPVVPEIDEKWKHWVHNPIDAFVLAKLTANGLSPSPAADRRVLARRVSIDLTGLPPTPEELAAFLADTADNAYERYVLRLLESPRYGERWARHWLDVAHYADSHGQDQDRFRPNAWPYRDYLIRSFNDDKPYDRFVGEQIAGDVLFPDQADALVATGFLAAGPWDESGLRDINENSIDRIIARYLDRDDIVTSTMSTFAGLTVHCARCHDHKFDPITQADYYALQAVFAGIDKAERSYDADPAVARSRRRLVVELERIRALEGKTDPSLLTPEWHDAALAFEKIWRAGEGRWFTPAPESWQAKQGASLKALIDRSILSVGPAPERDSYTVTLSSAQTGMTALRLELLCDDTLPHHGPGRCQNGNLHLSEIRVRAHPTGKPEQIATVRLRAARADFDQVGWGVARAIDGDPATAWGIFPEVGKAHQAVFEFDHPIAYAEGTTFVIELDQLHGGAHLIGRFRLSLTTAAETKDFPEPPPTAIRDILSAPPASRTPVQHAALARWLWERKVRQELDSLPPQAKVYCGTNQFAAEGSFRPAMTPHDVRILKRGEATRPGPIAQPGAIEAVAGLPGRFALADPSQEGARRAALVAWLVHPSNPLTWRVIVNRIWHYHFGRGIVATPNDFGRMGGAPSHTELLDWLATELRDGDRKLKRLHWLIVTSSTYRQAVAFDAAAAAKDGDNRLLWRMNRGRLDAESLRDAVLLASGRLDETMYGPPVKHFLTKPGIHVTPEADYDHFDVDAPGASRRSIYRFIFRTRPDPMLEALDCPDASLSAPVRSESLGAPQALVLWNNKFLLRQAEHLADLSRKTTPDAAEQVRFVGRRILAREASSSELTAWCAYARKHGLANLCRVLFNSSEFLFID